MLALVTVRATPALTQRSRALIADGAARAAAFFGRRWAALFEWTPPMAGPIAFPRLRLDAVARLQAGGGGGDSDSGGASAPPPPPIAPSVDAFCAAAVEEAGVLLLPASVYDDAASVAEGRFRVGLGRKGTAAALEALDAWLAKRFPGALAAAAAAAGADAS